MGRIVIFVNKEFEYKGFVEGLRDVVPVFAGTNSRDLECRFDNIIVDVYCIQRLFGTGENSSNSEMKYGYLKGLFGSNAFRLDDVDGVLSFSTSESTPFGQGEGGDESRNGCVYVGNRFFISDRREYDPTTASRLDIGDADSYHTESYVTRPVCSRLYEVLNGIDMKMKPANVNSANALRCFADNGFTCVGVANVMDYSCYRKADETAYEQFLDMFGASGSPIGIETTHGVVVKALRDTCSEISPNKDIPVTFVSPIVDRYLKFDEDVDGTDGRQNFICSYNGGIVTGHILKVINVLASVRGKFS